MVLVSHPKPNLIFKYFSILGNSVKYFGKLSSLILLNFIFRIGEIVWILTSINPKDRLSAEQLLDEEFSDKDIKVVERDKEMDGLKDTIRLQTQQITKQEELIAQQNKELLILRKLLQRVRNENEDL